jgi:hypothetical protein
VRTASSVAAAITVRAIAERPVAHGPVRARGHAGGGEAGLVVDGTVGLDTQHRVDRRHAEGDVRHVGGAGDALVHRLLGQLPADGAGLALPQGDQLLVVGELGVGGAGLVERHGRAGGDRAGLEAGLHPRVQLLELRERRGAGVPLPGGALGDDVGRVPAVGDDAVDPVGRLDVLAQQPDGHLRDRQRVGGVDAQLRVRGRVGGRPLVAHVEVLDRQARHPGGLVRRRVDHHGQVGRSKLPSRSMTILPPPPSSAGVPSTRTVIPSSSASGPARGRPRRPPRR